MFSHINRYDSKLFDFCKLNSLIIFFVVVLLAPYSFAQSENDKLNVLFILADDLGIHDLSVTGSNYYETPHIDGIAKSGTMFTNGYAASPVCSPSRASILTGQSPAKHGVTDWIGAASGKAWRDNGNNTKIYPPEYNHFIKDSVSTLPQQFQSAGYETFFAGKWHLGNEAYHPEHYGFNTNIGGWDVGNPKGGYYAPWENPKLPFNKSGENLTMRLAQETANFISEHKDTPFFAFLSFYAVHTPLQTSKDKWKKYRDKAQRLGIKENSFKMERQLPVSTTQDHPVYAGLVETMDEAVGLVIDKLKTLNLDKNTIIVFTSDNGGLVSSKYTSYATSNLPQRGGKGYQWEGGIRVPYFIKVPNIINASKEVEYPVTGADFYPTLLELAGIPMDTNHQAEGKSLVSLLKGKALPSRSLFWHYPHYGNQGGEPTSIIRKGNYKLIHYWEDGRNELYNLVTDIGEQKDLAKLEIEKTNELYKELSSYLTDLNVNTPLIDKDFDAEKYKALRKQRQDVMLPKLEKQRLDMLAPNFQPNETWWDSKLTKD